MKKIAILTINDYQNYGNRLQNYAAQEVIKSFGFQVETIVNSTNYALLNPNKITKIAKVKNLIELPVKEAYNKVSFKIWKLINKNKLNYLTNKKVESFKIFTSTYIKEAEITIAENNIPSDLSNKYDYFVTGSDQVWNPAFRYGSSIDFLTFAPPSKRIAYAPSFGVSEIPIEYVDKYKLWLSQMSNLSVRENAGANIIKDLTGRDTPVLVDPTLMLTKEKWISVSKAASNKPTKNYLLTYFLGGVSEKNKNIIKEISKKNDLQIVNLADMNEADTFVQGPSEFIDYINSASLFFTDSFHGVVFSILMETPFIVFDRRGHEPSMNSRIDTILSTFQLNSRLFKNINFDSNEEIFEVDFFHVESIVEGERNKVCKYLKGALQVK